MKNGGWQIIGANPVEHFLPAVVKLLKDDLVVCFEHANTCKPALELFSRFKSSRAYLPCRDTITPRTQLYYCKLDKAFTVELARLASSHELHQFLWHMRGFDQHRMVFYAHDACDCAAIKMSSRLPEQLVRQIAEASQANIEPSDGQIDWEKTWSREPGSTNP